MEEQDFLFIVAEVAIGLITFTTLVLILRQLVGGGLTPFHVLYIRINAVMGLLIVAFSMLPLVRSYLGLPFGILIRISSALLAAATIFVLIWYFTQRRVIAPGRQQNTGSLLSGLCGVVSPFILIPHALGVYYVDSFGPYAVGLLLMLAPIGLGFLATLNDFLSPDGDSDDAT
jgi:hypothetical protein